MCLCEEEMYICLYQAEKNISCVVVMAPMARGMAVMNVINEHGKKCHSQSRGNNNVEMAAKA